MPFIFLIGIVLIFLANKLEDNNQEKLSHLFLWLGLILIFISLMFR